MTKITSALFIAVVFFSACKTATFKKGMDDLEYKIISDGNGEKINYGDFMQIHFATYYNNGKTDSLLNSSRETGGPAIELLDSVSTPPAYFKILNQVRKGDSIVIRILADSAYKKSPDQMPPFMKKGSYLLTTVKVLDIFKNKESADSARQAQRLVAMQKDSIDAIAQLKKEDQELQAYFSKNNIKASKVGEGTYVETIVEGTGNVIDTSVIVKTNYTGRTLAGVMFDSNTDPSKGHVEPFNVNMTNNPAYGNFVIKGWKEGLQTMKKGGKAKFYVPSPLGYGKHGAGGDIGPNTILMFDIEVLDILTKDQAMAAAQQQKIKMQEMQKKYLDSISKKQGDTSRQ